MLNLGRSDVLNLGRSAERNLGRLLCCLNLGRADATPTHVAVDANHVAVDAAVGGHLANPLAPP
ncbi:hypothetical protein BE21_25115 [Sorangium cellulosum]|uniref:Uncharacterized protein n=1 Tax=Sorangium cellulosum TaxID=56 RepID=A0A150TU06_SORCE|nr:hypothetical protein BE21_25115 [Sorangium cellulosum]